MDWGGPEFVLAIIAINLWLARRQLDQGSARIPDRE